MVKKAITKKVTKKGTKKPKITESHKKKISSSQKGKKKNPKLSPVKNVDPVDVAKDLISEEDMTIIREALCKTKTGKSKSLKFDDKHIKLMIALASAGVTEATIIEALGFNGASATQIKNNNSLIKAIIDIGKANRLHKISNVVYSKALSGNLSACFFILKCQFGWNDKPGDDNNENINSSLVDLIRDLSVKPSDDMK